MDWPRGATRTAFGRQALSLVAQELRELAVTSILVPDYHCLSMLVPFTMEGIHVHVVETGHGCLMRPTALADGLRAHPGSAVLHCETFGNRAGRELAGVLRAARAAGSKIVVDRTHSWLDSTEDVPDSAQTGDYVVASLRKLIPTPDGAYATGLSLPVRVVPDEATRRATRARIIHLAEPGIASFEAAEDLADQAWVPAPPGAAAMASIEAFDRDANRAQRSRSAAALSLALAGMDLINPGAACCIALSHPRADRIMDALAAHGAYGPIHWGRPRRLPRTRSWRTDIVTLPVDATWTGREGELAAWTWQATSDRQA